MDNVIIGIGYVLASVSVMVSGFTLFIFAKMGILSLRAWWANR